MASNNATKPTPAPAASAPAPATVTSVPVQVATATGAMVAVLPAPVYGKHCLALGATAPVQAGKKAMPQGGANAPYAAALAAALAAGNGTTTVQVACNYCTAAGNRKYVNYALKQGWLAVAAPTK